jgi:hypothetical protein
MHVPKISSRSICSKCAIELRYDRPYLFLIAALAVLLAAGTIVIWAIRAPSRQSISLAIIASSFLALALARGRSLLDRKPVVIIDAIGICDRRLRLPVIPWGRITSADIENRVVDFPKQGIIEGLNVGVTLHIEEGRVRSNPPLPSRIYIDLRFLEMSLDKFVELMRHFAPDLPIDQSHNNAAP